MPPAAATPVLTLGAVVIAGSSALALATLAAPWLAEFPAISRLGPWSPVDLRTGSTVDGRTRSPRHCAAAAWW